MTEAVGMSGGLLSECGLPSSQMMKLLSADFTTTDDVKDMKPSELSQATGLSLKECVEVLRTASNSHHPSPVDMLQIYQEGTELPQIVTFCKALDTLLGGGIPLQAITEVSGMPGVGKTQVCLQACVSVQLPKSVGGVGGEAVYVDTEGSFTVKRLKDMASCAVHHVGTIGGVAEDVSGFTIESIMKGVHYFRCQNCVEVLAVVKNIPKLMLVHPNIRLLVLDSVSFHFRHDFPDARDRAKLLRTVTKELIQPAVTHKMAVLVTNHMTTNVKEKGSATLVPALGETWGHCPTLRLNLSWCGPTRVAALTKAPHCQNSSAYFQVSIGGLRDVSDNMQPSTAGNLQHEPLTKKRKIMESNDR
uniref:DNA repair protein RAD51 homolog 3 n=1 Tax=Scylla olivacea TaxID=85551 RepID=A0A0P4WF91_SCYOL